MKSKIISPSQFPNSTPKMAPYLSVAKHNNQVTLSKGLIQLLKLNEHASVQLCQDEENLKDWYIRTSPLSPEAFKLNKKKSGNYSTITIASSGLCKMIKECLEYPMDQSLRLPISKEKVDGWYPILTAAASKTKIMKEVK